MNTRNMLSTWIVLAAASLAPSGTYSVDWHTVDGGGGTSTGGGFELSGTIGQHDAGPDDAGMSGGTFDLVGGFWAVSLPLAVPGDCDGDGDVELDDLFDLAACLSGPYGGLGAGCECLDLDADDDTDLLDFATIQLLFTGS